MKYFSFFKTRRIRNIDIRFQRDKNKINNSQVKIAKSLTQSQTKYFATSRRNRFVPMSPTYQAGLNCDSTNIYLETKISWHESWLNSNLWRLRNSLLSLILFWESNKITL